MVNEPLSLPDWFDRVVIVLLAVGFPVALVLAWAFELSPAGVRRTTSQNNQPGSGNRVDFVLIAALLAVVVATAWNARGTDSNISDSSAAVPRSVAVLPFVDMSPEGDQAYFGDGIAEELLNELVRLEGLDVAGRTSSFSYKGSNADVPTIGAELGVDTILEGSVRKDGDRLRITAQLVKVTDGFHLWSETYDRDFDRIFEIQEEIAREVAGALGIRLGVGDVNAFFGAGTTSVEAYELYLRSSNRDTDYSTTERVDNLERAVELDPDYAAAWASLGLTIAGSMWSHEPERARELLEEGYIHVQRAVELDPDSAYALSLLGVVIYPLGRWVEAQRLIDRAVQLRGDWRTLGDAANLAMRTGRTATSQRLYDDMERSEPMGGRQPTLRMHSHLAESRYNEARQVLIWGSPIRRSTGMLDIALSENQADSVQTALDHLLTLNYPARTLHADIRGLLNDRDGALAVLRESLENSSDMWPSKYHDIAMLAAYFNDPQLAIESKSREVIHTPVRLGAFWHPVMSDVRRLPEFKTLVTQIGLVDYWREIGWADACRPVGEDDFECQ